MTPEWMFSAAFLVIAQVETTQCPSTDEWKNKLYIYRINYN